VISISNSKFKMQSKSIKYFFGAIMTFMVTPIYASDPSILEMRQMQSRRYDVNITDFLNGLNEVCKVRGGGLGGYSNDPRHLNSNLLNLQSGNMGCSPYDSKILNSRGYSMTRLNIQGTAINDKSVQVRIIANSFVDDGPGRKKTTPITDKNIYSIIFKDISDAIGVQDIPVQIKMAE
jgi:hypothetical protein